VNDPFDSKLHEAQLTFNRRYDFFFLLPKGVCGCTSVISLFVPVIFFPQ